MNAQRLGVIGVIIVALVMTMFAFYQQQQAANNEATAVARASAAKSAQDEADALRSTAVADAQIAGTAQAEADTMRSTAIVDAQTAGTAQAEANAMLTMVVAEATLAANEQALAQQSQATAIAQANIQATGEAQAQSGEGTAVALAAQAMAAQAQAESTRAAAVETAQAGAITAANQAQTATVAVGSASEQAALAATLASDLEQSEALLATQVALSTQGAGTAVAMAEQNVIIGATATAQSQIILDALEEIENFLTETTVPSPNQSSEDLSPEETVRFLVEEGIVPFYTGRVSARLGTTTIDLSDEDDTIEWESFSGEYGDFIVSVDIESDRDAREDRCGLVLRLEDDDNFYTLDFDGGPEIYFDTLIDDEWDYGNTLRSNRNLPITRNGINRMVVVAIEDVFTVYVNGEFAISYSDDKLTRGEVAVSATTFDDSDEMSCTFTNSWIWQLPDMSVTPTPLPSPTKVALELPDLTESFAVRDQSLVIRYPRGWTVNEYEQGRVVFYNQLEGTFTNIFPSGQIAGVTGILENPTGMLDAELALRLMTSTIDAMIGQNTAPLKFSEPASFALGPYDALRTVATNPDLDIVAIVYSQSNVFIVMFGLCAPGELALCEPLLRTIAENVEYAPQSNL